MSEELDELVAWLEVEDAHSRPFRAKRLRLLVEEYGNEGADRFFPGGPVSAQAFEEARLTYLDGSFLSCVLACQVCVEHLLAGLFRTVGCDDLDRASYQRLLKRSRDERFITEDEFLLFEELRTRRNPHTHYRSVDDEGSIVRRSVTADIPFEELLELDATAAVVVLLRLTRRSPFAV
jgi:hypothetical protein